MLTERGGRWREIQTENEMTEYKGKNKLQQWNAFYIGR